MQDVFDTKRLKEDEEYIYYRTSGGDENGADTFLDTRLKKTDFDLITTRLASYNYESNQLYNDQEYESLVKYETTNRGSGKLDKRCNGSRGIKEYIIGNASIFLILSVLEDAYKLSGRLLHNVFFKSFNHYFDFFHISHESDNIIDFLKYLAAELQSVRVKFNSEISYPQNRYYAELFLFQLAFDYDYSISLAKKDLSYLFFSIRHFGTPRKKNTEVSIPKKQYEKTIMELYKRAISSNTIEYQFLSFYQILEYLFDRILIEKHTDEMKFLVEHEMISHTYVYDLMARVNEDYKNAREEDLLRQVLLKYLGDDEDFHLAMERELSRYDETLIEYYKEHTISFTVANKFDLDDHTLEEVAKRLSQRVYALRNSIVHRKSKKNKFDPLLNSRELMPETILIRVVSEIIINNYSYDL